MHTLQRQAARLLGALALVASQTAHATDLPDGLNLACSGALAQSDGADLSLRCEGSFSLTGRGTAQTLVERSGSIALEAAGDLTLDGFTLAAPSISLVSRTGQILLAPDLGLRTPDSSATDPTLHVQGEVRLLNATGLIVRSTPSNDDLRLVAGEVQLVGMPPQVSSVPEPTTALLSLMGAALAMAWSFRRAARNRRQ